MNSVAFIHDHHFYTNDSNDAFSPGKLTNKSFERYLKHFSSITIVSRFSVIDMTQTDFGLLNKVTNDNVSFEGFPSQSNLLNRFVFRNYYRKKLGDILKNFDALIIRIPSEIGFLAAEVAIDLGIPYVCEIVACPADAMDGFSSFKASLYKYIISKTMRKTALGANGCLYVTERFLQEKYPTSGFSTSASNVEIDSICAPKVHMKKEKYLLISTGNLDSHHKGYDVLYAALKLMDSKISFKLEVKLVGQGKTFIKDNRYKNIKVTYPGALSKVEVLKELDSADLYLQPSNQEGLPRATIEAMSRGLPCVVSDAGGLPELVQDSLVHNKHSFEQLAEKVILILNMPQVYNDAANNNVYKALDYMPELLNSKRFNFFKRLKNIV
jgi:glycosyltransferase involved in cell wall biosynthesis